MRGGYGSGEHGTLAERAAAARPAPVATGSTTPRAHTPARHCLVGGQPALLVEWRQGERGWEGRVISVLWLDAAGWAVVERWLPAEDIAPA